MGGSSGGGSSSTKTGPPKWAVPYWTGAIDRAQGIYENPMQYYGGNTVAGFTDPQLQAQQSITNTAQQGPSQTMQNANSMYQNTLSGNVAASPSSGFYGNAMNGGLNNAGGTQGFYGNAMNGGMDVNTNIGTEFNPSNLLYGNMAAGQDQSGRMYSDTIAGNYLDPASNPWLRATFDQANQTVQPAFNSSAVNAGRYGSGAWGQGLGAVESNLATGIYGGNYQQERARQMQAAQNAQSGQLAAGQAWDANWNQDINNQFRNVANQQSNIANQFTGANALQSSAQQDIANQFLGANSADAQYQAERLRQMQAAQAAPAFDQQYRYGDAGMLAAVGQEQQAMNQAQIDEAMARYNFNQEAPRRDINDFTNILSGIQGGTSTVRTSGGK